MPRNLKLSGPVCIAPTGDVCGEGILWEPNSECIYWTDINRFLIHRFTLKDAAVKTWHFTEPVTCVLATTSQDTLALSLGSGVILWKPETDNRSEPLFSLPGWPFVRCNEAGVDPDGAIWIGSMRNNVATDGTPGEAGGWDGALYRIDGHGQATERRRGLGIANTLVWSADASKFYFGDTLKNCIWSCDYDPTGSIHDEQPFFEGFERGHPDGSAIDTGGYLWNCRYGGGCVVRVAPNGKVDRVIEMPVTNLTNCTFGGNDGNVLYITSARPGDGKWERFGGCLFAIETNVKGVIADRFKLP
jgi:sugar lactone lactonase YvrE